MVFYNRTTRAESNPSTDGGTSSSSENPFSDRHNRPSRSFSLRSSRESTQNEKAAGADFREEAPPVPGQTTDTPIATRTHLQPNQHGVGQDHSPTASVSGTSRTTSPNTSSSGSPEEERAAILESLPPLSANATTASIAADAIDPVLIERGKRKVARHKYIAISIIFVLNFMFIFSSWYWPRFYYIYLPFISLPLVLNCVMIFDIIVWSLKNLVFKPKKVQPETPEEMVLLMPCYNETYEECSKSLDSLVNQVNISHHKQAIMVVCDGKVRGPGMDKTTGDYLNEDIFVDQIERKMIRAAYVAWDGQSMDVDVSRGIYKGVPFFCIVKQQNQGKRDSLIVARSFVHNFNIRDKRPKVIFSPEFFKAMTDFLVEDAGMRHVELLVGMDADTVFAKDCISHLIEECHYPGTVGVCGYVAVDFSTHKWNIWSIYQNAEYTIAQGLRRLHQSLCTKKVSCLPGCCQLLRVCEETCGDRILIEEFGYHPKPTDGIIKRIRATASEDRNHVCLMLMKFPKARTRQALRAYAFTDVPHSLSVFLSQRRRWTLGATSNDLMLLMESNYKFNLWERIVALSNVLTWMLNLFAIASLACMVFAFIHQPFWLVMIFASIMIIPLCYYLGLAVWLCQSWLERGQYLLGLAIFTTCGPFINICVTIYACVYMDNFGWGKTRKVIAETGEAEKPDWQVQQERYQDALSDGEKIFGTMIPDEENQLHPEVYRTPFTAPTSSRLTPIRADSEAIQQIPQGLPTDPSARGIDGDILQIPLPTRHPTHNLRSHNPPTRDIPTIILPTDNPSTHNPHVSDTH
ncbi:glycosyltransferase family 2 protein [Daldinia vernicosa]|uniref:glycosyltransferase family 2 protein n=1 Tax=Daldinia vernicosa TaxID=114800 RepID=UPI0020077233|nr:glycosyltransferase family 2 protein [Daldinia vernicosa]KAI0846245.1 glycosyltransferase family 2 protein [Daldinia vernicosa]